MFADLKFADYLELIEAIVLGLLVFGVLAPFIYVFCVEWMDWREELDPRDFRIGLDE